MFSRILQHEWRSLRADATIWVVGALFAVAIGYGVWNGARWVAFQRTALAEASREETGRFDRLKAQVADIERSGKPVSPFADPRSPANVGGRFGLRYAMLPPGPLAPLAIGQSDLLPYYFKVSTDARENIVAATELENPQRLLVGRFDLAFVIIYLYPLLILGITYNMLSAEKEQGTLSLALSQPVSLSRLVAGKVTLRALLLVGIVVVFSAVALAAAGADLSTQDALPRLALWMAAVAAYGALWFALAILVASLGLSSASNATALAAVWLVLVVMLPSLFNLIATTAIPVPSRVEMVQAVRVASDEANAAGSKLLARYYEDHPELATGDAQQAMNDVSIVRTAVNDDVERRVRPVIDRFEQQVARQQALIDRLRFVSPAILMQDALNDVSGTGTARHRNFMAQVDEFHRRWRGYFVPLVFKKARFSAFDDIPRFQFEEETSGTVGGRVALSLVGLLVPALAIGWLGLRRMQRFPIVGVRAIPMEPLLHDLKHALRALRLRPGFSAVVILTLALGIGANTAIFSAVSALLLRPLPFADAHQLVRITSLRGGVEGGLSVPEQDDLAALDDVVADIALYTDQGMYNASGFGDPEELPATITTHNLFRVLGIEPMIGAMYPAETDRTRRFELVISHGLWTRRFGQDPHIVGRTMTLNGAPGYTIHGVLPAGLNFPSSADLFRSSGISADPASYRRRDLRARVGLARLQPGVTIEQARDRISALGRRLEREFPATNAGQQFQVTALRDIYVGNVRAYVLLLFGAVVLVLIVACSNVANLFLSRLLARERELAVRLALGASRARVMRQMLVESLVLALAGGAAGLACAWLGIELITRMVRAQLPPWMTIELDAATLGFLAAVSLLTGLATGLVPALRGSDHQVHAALKDAARGSSGSGRQQRLRSALVVGEVALAIVLLVAATLMVRSFGRLQRVDPGFDPAGLLTFRVELGWRAYDSHAKVIAFHEQVLGRLRALPGVTHVTLDGNLPLSGKARETQQVQAAGQSLEEQQGNPFVHAHVVAANYFDAMKIPLEAGRGFLETDGVGNQPVVIVSRRLASRLWPGQDPLGKSLQAGGAPDAPALTVVGVARDIRHQQLAMTDLDLYRPYRQVWAGGSWYVVRTAGVNPMSLANAATRIVPETDPNQSFFDVNRMDDRIASGIWQQQIASALFSLFGALTLALAAIGLYGVLSYLVSQQRREIGVRMALGASPQEMRRMVLGRGARLTGCGLVIGLALAWAASRALAPVLFEIPAVDPLTFAAVPIGLFLIALLACYLPARRATRVDPLVALRAD